MVTQKLLIWPCGPSYPSKGAPEVQRSLTVKIAPKRLARGKVTVTVTDAGAAVKGARVTLRGRGLQTNANGKAVFTIKPTVPDGRYPVVASKKGYFKGTARVGVT